jgi:gas vesicle protein
MTVKCYGVSMFIMETLFDVISASIGAILGAIFAFFLNRKRGKQMANQLVISKSALDRIKMENEELLRQIRAKENLIMKMQLQLLGNHATVKKPQKSRKK